MQKGDSPYPVSLPHVSDKRILDVPFFAQSRYQCGPASLAAVVNYWGKDITPEEIASEIFSYKHRGTLSIDLYLYAKKQGFKTTLLSSGIQELIRHIHAGHPVIIMVDLGVGFIQKNHFMVVIGYDKNGIYAHSETEKGAFFSYEKLISIWKRTDYWGMLLLP